MAIGWDNRRQEADIQTKVEKLNQALRNRDKMKDDAIAQLSDQVMALTARNAGDWTKTINLITLN